ncbi:MAG: (deoxy)nucleoside triphosphate pyrophosphohydrolase [Acidaminobacteraceae bacterium]
MKHIEGVAAIIIKDGKCLCTKRNISNYKYLSYKYEFPTAEVRYGEDANDALTREMFESLSAEVKVHDLCMTVEHAYPDFMLTLHAYYCQLISPEIELNEHIGSVWLLASELDQLDWVLADIPIVEFLMDN